MNVSNLVSLIFCRYVKYCDCEFSTAGTERMVVMFVKLHGLALRLLIQNYSINQIHHNLVLSLKTTKKALDLSRRNAKIVCGDCNFTNIADQVKQFDLIYFHDHDKYCLNQGIFKLGIKEFSSYFLVLKLAKSRLQSTIWAITTAKDRRIRDCYRICPRYIPIPRPRGQVRSCAELARLRVRCPVHRF